MLAVKMWLLRHALSAAKDLTVRQERSFATLRMTPRAYGLTACRRRRDLRRRGDDRGGLAPALAFEIAAVLAGVAAVEELDEPLHVHVDPVLHVVLAHRDRQRLLLAEQVAVGALEFLDVVVGVTRAAQADRVEPADLVGAVDLDERRDVVVDPRVPA